MPRAYTVGRRRGWGRDTTTQDMSTVNETQFRVAVEVHAPHDEDLQGDVENVIDTASNGRDQTQSQQSQETVDSDDTDMDGAVSQTDKAKRQKACHTLSPQEEEDLVNWLQAHPVLFNKKLPSYKDTARKELLWKEIAEQLGKPVMMLKTCYNSLKTRLGRHLKKPKSGAGIEDGELTEREEWIVHNFEFMRVHIHGVQKKPLVNVSKISRNIVLIHISYLKKLFSMIIFITILMAFNFVAATTHPSGTANSWE